MVARKWSGGLAVMGLAATFVVHACGGDQGQPPPTVTPPSSTTSTDTSDSSATETGSTTTPPPSMEEEDLRCGGEISGGDLELSANCTNAAPPNCNITSFEPDTYDFASHEWGNDTQLTGGSFTYQDDSIDAPVLMRAQGNGSLDISGEVYTYAGWGHWFGPCVDASHWEGLEFTVSGTLGGEEGQLTVQLQTDENYPIEGGSDPKGACDFTDEATKWDECKNPEFIVNGVSTEAATYRIPWAEFTGGKPNDGVDPRQLRGVQFQINCGEADTVCNAQLQVHDLRFYKEHPAYLGPQPEEDTTGGDTDTTTGDMTTTNGDTDTTTGDTDTTTGDTDTTTGDTTTTGDATTGSDTTSGDATSTGTATEAEETITTGETTSP